MKVIVDDIKLVKAAFKKLGYKTTSPRHKNANGPDVFAVNEHRSFSVEIKKARIANKGRTVFRVDPVEKNRREDDLIAIVHPSGYVLIEHMADHLKSCNLGGQRFIQY